MCPTILTTAGHMMVRTVFLRPCSPVCVTACFAWFVGSRPHQDSPELQEIFRTATQIKGAQVRGRVWSRQALHLV